MNALRSVADRQETSHGIDLAPMLDFVINLLIFFIITAVFLKESGVAVQRPAPGGEPKPRPAFTVSILGNGEIRVEDRVVDLRAVRANIEKLRAADPSRGVVIVADTAAPTGTLVGVVDQIHLGGIYDVTFSTTQ